ncbi:MAG TPA: winged helix-turn-helix domain-containing protein [Woeseiaceae bacterium]|nr:winged helix-turn-helix domain-containing protein [Woeseiaceae bacterium]
MPTLEELREGFTLGNCEVMPHEGVIRRDGEVLRPEPQTWRVLMALAVRDGKLVTKEDLVREVWDGRAVADDPINRAIREVRKCFGDSAKAPTYLETLHKRGYRLLQKVEPLKREIKDRSATEISVPALRRWKLAAAVLAVSVIVILAVTQVRISPPPPVRSIAILPFENLSGRASDEYIVSGLKVALVQALHGMQDFVVKNGAVSYQMEPDEIATLLGVESVLIGTLQRSGDLLRVSYFISTDGQVEFSDSVEGMVSDLFSLQEKLATAVRANLGDDLTPALITGHRPGSEAYDSYMRGMYALEHRGEPGRLEEAIVLFQAAIERDRQYGPSYLALATAYALMPDYRALPLDEMNRMALAVIESGVSVDPVISNAAGAIYGFVYHKEKRWQEAEEAYRRAVGASVIDSNAFNWYSRMLSSVGRMDAALAQALRALELDPRSTVNNSRAAIAYTWLGDSEKAREYFVRANHLGAKGPTHMLAYAFLLSRDGDIELARNVATVGMELAGDDTSWIGPVFDAFADPQKIPAALAVLDTASASPQVQFTARTLFGDTDGAMEIARQLEQPGEVFEMDLLFVPELKAIRQHPDFMPLMERLGITEYWRQNACEFRDDRVVCDSR